MKKIKDRHKEGGYLPHDRGNGSTPNAHMEHKNKDRVKHRIDHRAQSHGEHGIFRASVRPDHGIERRRDHHEGKTDANDSAVLQRIGPQDVCCTEQRQDRIDPYQKNHQQHNAHNGHHGDGIAHALLRLFDISLSQLQTQIGRTAVTDHQGKRQRNDGNGKYHIRRTVAEIAHAPADKDLVYNVIKRVHQQRNDAGNGELCDQAPNGLRGKRAFVF